MNNFIHRYDIMMSGGIAKFTENEVFDFLDHMDYFHINTLSVQADGNDAFCGITKWFVCKVDEVTVRAYVKEKESEKRIV